MSPQNTVMSSIKCLSHLSAGHSGNLLTVDGVDGNEGSDGGSVHGVLLVCVL